MSQLYPEERIAVALLGWQRDESKNSRPDRDREYSHPNLPKHQRAAVRISDGQELMSPPMWPNFSHSVYKFYYIHEAEDAIAKKKMWKKYAEALTIQCLNDLDPEIAKAVIACAPKDVPNWNACLGATIEQRIKAMVRVLDSENL